MHGSNSIFTVTLILSLFFSIYLSKEKILSNNVILEGANKEENTIVESSEIKETHNDFDRYSFGSKGFWISVVISTSILSSISIIWRSNVRIDCGLSFY